MRDDEPNERWTAVKKERRQSSKSRKQAGDQSLPPAPISLDNAAYPKLIRAPYEFKLDEAVKDDQTDIILQGGCSELEDPLDG